jgi:hypothetical protein
MGRMRNRTFKKGITKWRRVTLLMVRDEKRLQGIDMMSDEKIEEYNKQGNQQVAAMVISTKMSDSCARQSQPSLS